MIFDRLTHLAKSLYQREWLRWGLGFGVLIALILTIGLEELSATFRRVSAHWALFTALGAVAWFFVGGFNVWLLLQHLVPIRLITFIRVYITSWAISLLVPGQLGDASQLVLLRRQNISMGKSGAAYMVDKAISLSWMLLVAAYGVSVYTQSLQGWWFVLLALLGGTVGGVGLSVMKRLTWPAGGLMARVKGMIDQLWAFKHCPGILAFNAAMTVVKWVLMALLYWMAFSTFGSSLDFTAVATIPVMSSLVGYIPITVGGVGTTEWTAVALFSQIGATGATVLGVYLFMRALLLFLAFCLLLILRPQPPQPAFGAGELGGHSGQDKRV